MTRIVANLKALIFDVDGTLADTEEVHRCAFNEAFKQLGLDWHWSRPMYAHLLLTAGGKERLAAYIHSLAVTSAERESLTARIAAMHRAKTEHYTRMVLEGRAALRDGVARLIDDALASGVLLAIATTTSYANVETLLGATLGPDAIGRFAAIGAGDQVPRKKPAPDVYEYVLGRLELAPQDCVALEDSANGLHAAKAAGLYTIITPSYWTRTEDFSAADLLLPSLGSAERPLAPNAARRIGGSMLGIHEIDQQLHAVRKCG